MIHRLDSTQGLGLEDLSLQDKEGEEGEDDIHHQEGQGGNKPRVDSAVSLERSTSSNTAPVPPSSTSCGPTFRLQAHFEEVGLLLNKEGELRRLLGLGFTGMSFLPC